MFYFCFLAISLCHFHVFTLCLQLGTSDLEELRKRNIADNKLVVSSHYKNCRMKKDFFGFQAKNFRWFLGHLSRRLTGELMYTHAPVSIRRPHFSSETAGPIKAKLHVEHP